MIDETDGLSATPRRGLVGGDRGVATAVVCAVVWTVATGACSGVESDRLDEAGRFFSPVGGVAMAAHGAPASPSDSEATPLEGRRFLGGPPAEKVSRLPDSAIRLDVALAIRASDVASDDVEVTVEDQRVLLEGDVRDGRARDRVELIARRAEGVRGVVNRLDVARPASSR